MHSCAGAGIIIDERILYISIFGGSIMEIMFEKCLRDILTKRGKTQRELAEHLSISTQAVSKWCRGENMPDIALLPKIAYFLDISVDELLGVGEIRKQEKIEEYAAESQKLSHAGRISERVALWRKACAEFPNEFRCQCELMLALNLWQSEDKGDEVYEEIISIGKKVLRESTESSYRHGAIQMLVLNLMNLERYDEAKKYAQMAPHMFATRNALMTCSGINILESENEDGRKRAFSNIMSYIELIGKDLYTLCCNDRGNYERYIKLHELYLKMYDLIFDDGFYGFYNNHIKRRHYWLAKLYTNIRNDEAKAREHLEAAAKCAIDFDNLPEKFVYKATLFGDGWEYNMENTSKTHTLSDAQVLLEKLDGQGLGDSAFDRWRGKDWFKAIVSELEAAK